MINTAGKGQVSAFGKLAVDKIAVKTIKSVVIMLQKPFDGNLYAILQYSPPFIWKNSKPN